jgi:hypothetical protein
LGRQDHTTSPSAIIAARLATRSASTASRLAFRDVRETPLVLSRDGRKIAQLLKKRKKILSPIPDIPNAIDFLDKITVRARVLLPNDTMPENAN